MASGSFLTEKSKQVMWSLIREEGGIGVQNVLKVVWAEVFAATLNMVGEIKFIPSTVVVNGLYPDNFPS